MTQSFVNSTWLKENIPCMHACPVNTEAGRYVNLIAQGRWKEAFEVARRPNPFASICGRICAAPCEDVCRRGELDKPVAIRALKRFVCERYGIESIDDTGMVSEILRSHSRPQGPKVAIIGSGPAGMSAAHDLALNGYRTTVFEAQEVAGGMLRLGIPEYRLPRELIRMEINAILGLGVELKCGWALGRDFTLGELKADGYEAIFVAIGAMRSRELKIEGAKLDGVLNAVDFLLNVNLGYKVDLGENILVIGGGNVAFDAARTATRQLPVPEASSITGALDVARSAIRFGAKEVHLVCLESQAEIPADEEEIAQSIEERIEIHAGWGPTRLVGEQGRVVGLEAAKCLSVFDQDGKFNPVFVPEQQRNWKADAVILAIGQTPDLSFLLPEDGIELTARGTIKVDPNTLKTTAEGVFAGGDVAFGPRIAIEAVANGKRAATAIDNFLRSADGSSTDESIQVSVLDTFDYNQYEDFEKIPRVPIPALKIDRRVGIAEVETGYDEALATLEAKRCLRCWINTEFKGSPTFGTECMLCRGCVDICPEECIEIVHFDNLNFEPAAWNSFCESADEFVIGRSAERPDEYGAVMIKDETKCIRCGLCAKRCPTGCITMDEFNIVSIAAHV
jgi:NADPH-dependent glutamate synthase beta subunit-like oxidoreductase/ferredoxin